MVHPVCIIIHERSLTADEALDHRSRLASSTAPARTTPIHDIECDRTSRRAGGISLPVAKAKC
jgi:hypothetical protein